MPLSLCAVPSETLFAAISGQAHNLDESRLMDGKVLALPGVDATFVSIDHSHSNVRVVQCDNRGSRST
jgi:hypothetical protein